METYFDMLPDDILDILLRKSKDLRIAKHIGENISKRYARILDLIDKGCIIPDDYFEIFYNDDFIHFNDTDITQDLTDNDRKSIVDVLCDMTTKNPCYYYHNDCQPFLTDLFIILKVIFDVTGLTKVLDPNNESRHGVAYMIVYLGG